jgi:phosphatidylserine decarboxylase
MRLAPEGVREWGLANGMAAVVLAPLWIWCPIIWLNWCVTAVVGALYLFIMQFFRDPDRCPGPDVQPGDCMSPADGVVSAIESVEEHEAIDGPAVIIRIFLNVFNVHVNRVPCDAVVRDAIYRKGKFLDARKPESAIVNESNLVRMTRTDGLQFAVRQVSGAIARRIVCPLSGGESLTRAQRMGMIKFGSTTELILPQHSDPKVHVALGDTVTGGVTVLATVELANQPST